MQGRGVTRPRRQRRRIGIAAACVVLGLLLAHAVYWRVASSRLETGFRAWTDDMRRQGWTVSTGSASVGGWPVAARLTVGDFAITGGAPLIPGGMRWNAKQVAMRVDLLQPWQVEILPTGPQHLHVGDGVDVPFAAERMKAVIPLLSGPPWTADIESDRLSLSLPTDANADSRLRIGHLDCHVAVTEGAGSGEEAVGFAGSAEAIELPSGARWPLGRSIASFAAEGSLDGPIPAASSPAAFAAAWRDAGGPLKLQKANLVWGPLTLELAATLALDDQLQPMGAGTSRIVGYDATLDALAGGGILTRSAAVAAKAVLSLLASAPAEGEVPEVDVPLTLQYRTLSMRQVPLIRFPELDWPSP